MKKCSILKYCLLPLFFVGIPGFLLVASAGNAYGIQEAGQLTENVIPSSANKDESAVRKSIDSFVAAFKRRDASAFAAHWSESGESIAPDGTALQGRKQIEKEYAAFFESNESAKIELTGSTIDFLSPNVAVETGVARIFIGGEAKGSTGYEVIRMRSSNGWLIDSFRESDTSEAVPSNYGKLKELEWMIGSWTDGEEEFKLTIQCRWTTNQNFIVRSFQLETASGLELEGTEVIGWDPEKQVIRSWMFDSDGGFGAGRWTLSDDRWTVQFLQIMPDGRRASSTNIYDVKSDGSVDYRSIGRQVGGELMPSVGPISISRDGE